MYKFLFTHIFKSPARNISIIVSIFLIFLISIVGIFIFQNTTSAINYYSRVGKNEKQVSLTTSSNIFNIFQNDYQFEEKDVEKILNDEDLENVKVFRLVNMPVSAKFELFTFELESDIPIFSVTDKFLTGASIPVGMSKTMLDLYNTQIAGSSEYFFTISEKMILWQKIEFTFGKSKIFASSEKIGTPFVWKITTINNNFPGLGLVLPESIVKEKLHEIWAFIGAPYKVIADLKDLRKKAEIRKKYPKFDLTFEAENISAQQEKIQSIALIIILVGVLFGGIVVIFFLFLLLWYFRERQNIFAMIRLFGLKSFRSYIITLGEPLILVCLSCILSLMIWRVLMTVFFEKISEFLLKRWVLFPIENISTTCLLLVIMYIFITITCLIIILDFAIRNQQRNSKIALKF